MSQCSLVGGPALHAYRYTRQTLDFDFMVAASNYVLWREYLGAEGFTEKGRMGQFGRFRPSAAVEPVLDIGVVDDATVAKLWTAAEARMG